MLLNMFFEKTQFFFVNKRLSGCFVKGMFYLCKQYLGFAPLFF